MTGEEAIKHLDTYSTTLGSGQTSQAQHEEAKRMGIMALKQMPVLDKIRAELEQEYNRLRVTRADETLELGECLGLKMALKIVNKYKEEIEDKG